MSIIVSSIVETSMNIVNSVRVDDWTADWTIIDNNESVLSEIARNLLS